MKKNSNGFFTHACKMVQKTFNNYMLLSVTILLSFSFLISFLILTDSNTYNKYKKVMNASPYISIVTPVASNGMLFGDANDEVSAQKINYFMKSLNSMQKTSYYRYFEISQRYTGLGIDVVIQSNFIPYNTFAIYSYSYKIERLKFIKGKENISASDEILIGETFYDFLIKANYKEPITVELPIPDKFGTVYKAFRVVGVFEEDKIAHQEFDKFYKTYKNEHNKILSLYAPIYFPQAVLKDPKNSDSHEERILIYSENIEEVVGLARGLTLACSSIYEDQNKAMDAMRSDAQTKCIIIVALFIILGINLYSSFKNALNERRFEIGVKRAIGASKFNIIAQFFYEGIVVMLFNTILSVSIALDVMLIYKLYMKLAMREEWIIFLNPYSALMCLVCVLFLSVSFSVIFAYQSTNVVIIDQIKAE